MHLLIAEDSLSDANDLLTTTNQSMADARDSMTDARALMTVATLLLSDAMETLKDVRETAKTKTNDEKAAEAEVACARAVVEAAKAQVAGAVAKVETAAAKEEVARDNAMAANAAVRAAKMVQRAATAKLMAAKGTSVSELASLANAASIAQKQLQELFETAKSDAKKSNWHMDSLIHNFAFKEKNFASEHAIVQLDNLNGNNKYIRCARACAKKLREDLRNNNLSRTVRELLIGGVGGTNLDNRVTLESLVAMIKASRASIALPDGTSLFLLGALCQLHERASSREQSVENEATTRKLNNWLLANAIRGVRFEEEHSPPAAARNDLQSTATVRLDKRRVADEMRMIDGRVVYASETTLSSHSAAKRYSDRQRLNRFALSSLSENACWTHYMFSAYVLNYDIDIRVTIPLFWRVLLELCTLTLPRH